MTLITTATLQMAYEVAYREMFLRKMAGQTPHPDSVLHAQHYGGDPMEPTPGEHYSASDHIEAIRIGNMTAQRAIERAQESGRLSAVTAAKDRLAGNLPPSTREHLGVRRR